MKIHKYLYSKIYCYIYCKSYCNIIINKKLSIQEINELIKNNYRNNCNRCNEIMLNNIIKN